jgi:hypothetical protein
MPQVYRRYSQIPFADIYHYERSRRSIPSLFFADFPSFIAITGLRVLPRMHKSVAHNYW